MITTDTFKRGFKNGIVTMIELSKILIPVYIAVQLLSISGIINIIAKFFHPAMSLFGLPGEASLVILLGYFLGTYAALGAMAAFELSAVQVTTIAIMISIAHSLFTESAVVRKLGLSTTASIVARLFFSVLMGFLHFRIFG
ncbi:MAG TPA: nucleoside recognition protein [Tissierellia bacterium]|nr:nucleoside recognition protein [Tissierellia bacterium]